MAIISLHTTLLPVTQDPFPLHLPFPLWPQGELALQALPLASWAIPQSEEESPGHASGFQTRSPA